MHGSYPLASNSPPPASGTAHCHYCGAVFDTAEWYPVVTASGDDDTVELYKFCAQRCRQAWLAETPDD